ENLTKAFWRRGEMQIRTLPSSFKPNRNTRSSPRLTHANVSQTWWRQLLPHKTSKRLPILSTLGSSANQIAPRVAKLPRRHSGDIALAEPSLRSPRFLTPTECICQSDLFSFGAESQTAIESGRDHPQIRDRVGAHR